jgi:CubicO group peptidase (beta-lactamase class C family)
MPRLVRHFSLAVLFLLSAHCRAEDGVASKVDDFVRAEMLTQHIPGVSLLVNKDGKIVLAKGYGLANVEHQVPVKPETVFQSGSVGKQFTATAVMMLVEDGKISLDDKINQYLTNVPQTWANIKVRHLLTHTSGLGDYPSDFDLRRDYTEDELLKRVTATTLAFQPGEKWSYSNLGYLTLGILIGKVTGKFYGEFFQERIFKPLRMTTARIISEAEIVTNRAAGYRLVDGKLKNQEWVSPTMDSTADGSLYLTVYDVAKWDTALYTEKLLKRSSFDQMWTPVTLNNGKKHPYGFGWFVVDVRGHRLIHHGGSWQGFHCDIQRYVDDKLTVIGFDNLAGSNLEKIVRGVAAIYNPELKPEPPKER